MNHTASLHNITNDRNLYAGEPPATLRAEAERLNTNRAVIAADLTCDPRSWAGGHNNIDFLDVVLGDALAAMLHHPSMIAGVGL